MYSMSHHPPTASINGGGIGSGMMDGSGTINPAALNSSGLSGPAQAMAPQASPRGTKRSRSPDGYGDLTSNQIDDDRQRKRGRGKGVKDEGSPTSHQTQQHNQQQSAGPVRTPQLKAQSLPKTSPSQASPPPKSTPSKNPVLKALPTVRDHTTDQLNPEGDEYIPREYDEAGEKKVTPMGEALDGRVYRCRTFMVPNRGEKLFMLATECARALNYRDSYLLFNKNRSLYKIIATQPEKDNLIQQEILPYSYRSRQIAIVTARSMFRQFGSRLINGGRRVRDDYWESKARKQGFTEEDMAGEKRPGATKQREAATAEASAAHSLTSLPHGEIIYSNGPAPHIEGQGMGGINPSTLAPLPMINLAPTDDNFRRDYSNIQRPRHEISGTPYADRTQPSGATEILNQSAQAAEFNKTLGQQRSQREQYMTEYWKRPHEVPDSPQRQGTAEGDTAAPVTQGIQSPHVPAASNVAPSQQSMPPRPQTQPHVMNTQSYSQQSHQQNPMHSPMHPMHTPMRQDQMHHRSPSIGMGPSASHGQQPAYGYPNNQMWPPQQPQPSPLAQHHNMQQYGQPSQQQHSPHPPQSQLHQSPQMHPTQSTGPMHNPSMGYPAMGGMNAPSYPSMGRSPYQPGANPQQFMHQSTAAQQPGMQGWAPPQQQQQQQQQQQHTQQPGWSQF